MNINFNLDIILIGKSLNQITGVWLPESFENTEFHKTVVLRIS